MAYHMKIHNKWTFACHICDYKNPIKSNFENHKLSHAAKNECTICKKQVKFLESHMKSHKIRKCESCEETFVNADDLRR